MSKKLKKWTEIVAMAVVAGICLVQIIYAVLWAVRNGNNVQDFYDTAIYLNNALTMKSDGWRLIGYSCFLKLFLPLEENYAIPVYLVQCIVSLLCYAQMARSCGKFLGGLQIPFFKALIVAVYLITIPVIWQMQYSILPDALCLSFSVLLCSALMECWSAKDKISPYVWAMMGGSLFILGILEQHYFYGGCLLVGMNLIIWFILFLKKKNRNRKIGTVLIGVLLILLIIPILTGTVRKITLGTGAYASYSIEADLWKRFVYPNITEDYPYYSNEIHEILSEEDVEEYSGRYEYYMSGLLPQLEASGEEDVKDLCMEMVKTGWAVHKKELMVQSAKESISYALMPVAMIKYMYNNANSLYGYNYSRMYEVSAGLTADYMHVGMNGFFVVCLLGMLMVCLQTMNQKKLRKPMFKTVVWGMVTATCITFPAMIFSFARFDYRVGLFSAFIWAVISMMVILLPLLKNSKCGITKNVYRV